MPKATATQETVRKDLKSCPPDGFVVLRKMNYGERLKQRDLAMDMSPDLDDRVKMKMNSEESTAFEFRICIIDHNLEAEDGRKLDFRNKMDVVSLDPKVATEIETYLNELNQPEDLGVEKEGFPTGSSSQSSQAKSQTSK